MQNVSSSNSEKALVPKLRFPEFTDEWEKVYLKEVFNKNSNKNNNGKITNVICNSAHKGLIPQREYFEKDIANSSNTKSYYTIEYGDFVYNPRKSNEAPYGPINTYNYKEKGIVSPLYLCFRPIGKIVTDFYKWLFKSSVWYKFIYISGDNGVRHDRVSIKDSVFFDMPLFIPKENEQSKIADFLSFIDKKIQLQQQLIENLKLYKRGLLSYIFSNNNWNKTKFTNIFETISDKTYQVKTSDYLEQGTYEVVDQGKKLIAGYSNDEKKLFYNTPVIVYGDHTTIVKFRKKPFIIGGDGVKLLKPKDDTNIGYLYYALLNYNIIPEGYKRHFSILKNIELPVPNQDIQILIYNLFDKLDKSINTYTNILYTTKKVKESLLQQMFI